MLETYNREDCQALKALTDTLFKIQQAADTLSEIDFADQPKQHATEVGKEVHSQFEAILKFAHFGYDKKKIRFRQREEKSEVKQKRGSKQGYQGQRKYGLSLHNLFTYHKNACVLNVAIARCNRHKRYLKG